MVAAAALAVGKMLIVDGYNVLRSGDFYSNVRSQMPDYGDEAFNSAREALINDVAAFAGSEYRSLIVFDGAGNSHSDGQVISYGSVEAIFSRAGVSADSVIEKQARQASERGLEVLVVTSDASTQWTVMGGSITRMSASGFYSELKALRAEANSPSSQVAYKNTLGERIPQEVLEELRRRFGI